MSRTLFFYIFKDLLRIFLMTSGALAGIMSFGGLLRPLTEHGLNAAQAAKMLSYFMPAMMTYSLPIAALFATTMVYGRLAADNEIVACRAAGISFRSMGLPALFLGLLVSLISLLFLCFIVPVFTLKVEQVIYSNLAEVISNQIEQTHQIKFNGTTVFAQEASVAPGDPRKPKEQIVHLGGLMIIAYDKVASSTPDDKNKLEVPRDFYLARQATVFIRRSKTGDFTLQMELEHPGGVMFPRRFTGSEGSQGGVSQTQYGPIVMPSMIRENTKFMDIRRLHELYNDLGESKRVQTEVDKIVRAQQQAKYLADIEKKLASPGAVFHIDAGNEQYDLSSPNGVSTMRSRRLVLTPAKLVQTVDGKPEFTWSAAELELSADPADEGRLAVQAILRDVTAQTTEGSTGRKSFVRNINAAMPSDVKSIAQHNYRYFESSNAVPIDLKLELKREVIKLSNSIQSEMHSRASFAISCLILVVVGCALGMMFKSGNFLTAFAISVVPALVCIALIVSGQHTCENVPWKLENFQNPLSMGLYLMWSGNVIVLILAAVLWGRLARQ